MNNLSKLLLIKIELSSKTLFTCVTLNSPPIGKISILNHVFSFLGGVGLRPVYIMDMKSDHGRWPFSMVRVHGPTSIAIVCLMGYDMIKAHSRKRCTLSPKRRFIRYLS